MKSRSTPKPKVLPKVVRQRVPARAQPGPRVAPRAATKVRTCPCGGR